MTPFQRIFVLQETLSKLINLSSMRVISSMFPKGTDKLKSLLSISDTITVYEFIKRIKNWLYASGMSSGVSGPRSLTLRSIASLMRLTLTLLVHSGHSIHHGREPSSCSPSQWLPQYGHSMS
jgi:hypothetical protein